MAKILPLTPKQNAANKLLGGPQRHTCLVGGSRAGKTALLIRGVIIRAARAAESRHAVLRFRGNAARSAISLDTIPRVRRMWFPGLRMDEHRQDGFWRLPNGSEIWVGGLDDQDRVEKILGTEFATIFLNECSQIPYQSVLVALTRLAQKVEGLVQRAWYDLNPVGKTHWTNRIFGDKRDPATGQPLADPENYARMFLNPIDNAKNLTKEYIGSLKDMPERQRRRFFEGVYVDEMDGALWTYELIERQRDELPIERRRRVVVAVDPSGASKDSDKADEIGIVVAAMGDDGHGYVLADLSLRDSPAVWGRAAVNAFHNWGADSIIGEKNFGGEMVRFVIRAADPNVPVRLVTASRGKAVRAEPISALYEKGKVHHVGRFPRLEEQLCAFTTSGYRGEDSPDHADACVWALTDLMAHMLGEIDIGMPVSVDIGGHIPAQLAAVTSADDQMLVDAGGRSAVHRGFSDFR